MTKISRWLKTALVVAALGFTCSPNKSSEWSFAYMHVFEEKVKSSKTAFGIPGSIQMYENSVDVSYSMKF